MKTPEFGQDPIVEEVRRVRGEHAKKFDYDLEAIVRDVKRHEREKGREVVSLPRQAVRRGPGAA